MLSELKDSAFQYCIGMMHVVAVRNVALGHVKVTLLALAIGLTW